MTRELTAVPEVTGTQVAPPEVLGVTTAMAGQSGREAGHVVTLVTLNQPAGLALRISPGAEWVDLSLGYLERKIYHAFYWT